MEITILHTEEEFGSIRPEWEELHSKIRVPTTSLSYAWMRSWWSIYGLGSPRKLFIITFRSAGQLQGILPLYIVRRFPFGILHAAFIGKGMDRISDPYPEYLDIIGTNMDAKIVTTLLLKTFRKYRIRGLTCGIVRMDSFLGQVLLLSGQQFQSWIANLYSSFSTYLERRPADAQKRLARLLKTCEKRGGQLQIATNTNEAAAFLDELVLLHQKRWHTKGEPGAFPDERRVLFHKKFLTLATDEISSVRPILARLHLENKTASLNYGFLSGRRFEFYQTAYAENSLPSPGITLHLELMKEIQKQDVTEYDFLAGNQPYKQELADRSHPCIDASWVEPRFPWPFLSFLARRLTRV